MSTERRAAVANWQRENIASALLFCMGIMDGDEDEVTRARVLRAADAAIAAMQAPEPEPNTADTAYYVRIVDDVLTALTFSQHVEREALEEVRAFLIAARKAQP